MQQRCELLQQDMSKTRAATLLTRLAVLTWHGCCRWDTGARAALAAATCAIKHCQLTNRCMRLRHWHETWNEQVCNVPTRRNAPGTELDTTSVDCEPGALPSSDAVYHLGTRLLPKQTGCLCASNVSHDFCSKIMCTKRIVKHSLGSTAVRASSGDQSRGLWCVIGVPELYGASDAVASCGGEDEVRQPKDASGSWAGG
jgi:hypothetical protein